MIQNYNGSGIDILEQNDEAEWGPQYTQTTKDIIDKVMSVSVYITSLAELEDAITDGHTTFVGGFGDKPDMALTGEITLPGAELGTDFDWIFLGAWNFKNFTIKYTENNGYGRAVQFYGTVILNSDGVSPLGLHIESRGMSSDFIEYVKSYGSPMQLSADSGELIRVRHAYDVIFVHPQSAFYVGGQFNCSGNFSPQISLMGIQEASAIIPGLITLDGIDGRINTIVADVEPQGVENTVNVVDVDGGWKATGLSVTGDIAYPEVNFSATQKIWNTDVSLNLDCGTATMSLDNSLNLLTVSEKISHPDGVLPEHSATVGQIDSAIDQLKIDLLEHPIAGYMSSLYLTGELNVWYNLLQDDAGSVPSAFQTVTVGDDEREQFTIFYLSQQLTQNALFFKGEYKASLSVQSNNTHTGFHGRYEIEAYLADLNGGIIDSGITGAPIGTAGVRVITILTSGLLSIDTSLQTIVLSGTMLEELNVLAGQRFRLQVYAEKVGTVSGDVNYTLFTGSDHQSKINIPLAMYTSSIMNDSGLSGNTLKDVLNGIQDLRGKTQSHTGFTRPALVVENYTATGEFARTAEVTGIVEMLFEDKVVPTMVSGWRSLPHDDVTGAVKTSYYLYFNGTDFVWTTTPWEFTHAMIMEVYYGVNDKFAIRECHGLMDWNAHKIVHKHIGTYRDSGGLPVPLSWTPNSTAVGSRRPTIASAVINDEDLPTAIAQIATGEYVRFSNSTTGTPVFDKAQDDFITTTGGRFNWESIAGGVYTNTTSANNDYAKVWVVDVPVTADAGSQVYRTWWTKPQAVSQNIDTIRAIPWGSYNWGTAFPGGLVQEFAPILEIIIRSTTNNWQIIEISAVAGSKNSSSLVSSLQNLSQVLALGNNALDQDIINLDNLDVRTIAVNDPVTIEGQVEIKVSTTPVGTLVIAGTEAGTGPAGVGTADGTYTFTGATLGQMTNIYQRGADLVYIGQVASIWVITNNTNPGLWTDSEYFLNSLSPVGTYTPIAGSGNVANPTITEGSSLIGSTAIHTNGDVIVGGDIRSRTNTIDDMIIDGDSFDTNNTATVPYSFKRLGTDLLTIQSDGSAKLPGCTTAEITENDDIVTKGYSDLSYQPKDATLTALAGLATGVDKVTYSTGVDTFAQTDFTATARTLVANATVAGMRTTLEASSFYGTSLFPCRTAVANDYLQYKEIMTWTVSTINHNCNASILFAHRGNYDGGYRVDINAFYNGTIFTSSNAVMYYEKSIPDGSTVVVVTNNTEKTIKVYHKRASEFSEPVFKIIRNYYLGVSFSVTNIQAGTTLPTGDNVIVMSASNAVKIATSEMDNNFTTTQSLQSTALQINSLGGKAIANKEFTDAYYLRPGQTISTTNGSNFTTIQGENTNLAILQLSQSSGSRIGYIGRYSEGTIASPTAITASAIQLVALLGRGHDGVAWTDNRAGIAFYTGGAWSSGATPTYCSIFTTAGGAVVQRAVATFHENGTASLPVAAITDITSRGAKAIITKEFGDTYYRESITGTIPTATGLTADAWYTIATLSVSSECNMDVTLFADDTVGGRFSIKILAEMGRYAGVGANTIATVISPKQVCFFKAIRFARLGTTDTTTRYLQVQARSTSITATTGYEISMNSGTFTPVVSWTPYVVTDEVLPNTTINIETGVYCDSRFNNQFSVAQSMTATPAQILALPSQRGMVNVEYLALTTTGDMIYATTNGQPVRLPKGVDGQHMTMNSGLPAWTNPKTLLHMKNLYLEDPVILDYIPIFRNTTGVTITILEAYGFIENDGNVSVRLYYGDAFTRIGAIALGASATTLNSTSDTAMDYTSGTITVANGYWVFLKVESVTTQGNLGVSFTYKG